MSWGSEAEVVAPEELRTAVRSDVGAMHRMYACDASRAAPK